MVVNNFETASSSSATLMESSTLSATLAHDRMKEENGASKTLGADSVPSIPCSNKEETALDENLRGKSPDRGDGGCAKLSVDTPRSEKEEVAEVEMIDGRPKDIYDRFSKRQKIVIVAIISYSAFIARKLHSTVCQRSPHRF